VMCTHNGKPFHTKEHWQRFMDGARELNLRLPITAKKFEEILNYLLKSSGFKKANFRTVLTGGINSDGGTIYEPGRETFYILVEKFTFLPKEYYTKGIGVITLDYDRSYPIAKITNYVAAIKNQDEKKKSKAFEIIYTKNGKASEASTCNFFIVKKGKLITTKNDILIGITRNVVIKLAKKNKIPVVERDIKVPELFSADEMFLTATNKDVVPVVRIDGKKVGNGKVGETTKKMMKLFAEFVEKY